MKAQQYIDEEEDLDVNADSRSVDIGNHGWMRRRNTQVAPEGIACFCIIYAYYHSNYFQLIRYS